MSQDQPNFQHPYPPAGPPPGWTPPPAPKKKNSFVSFVEVIGVIVALFFGVTIIASLATGGGSAPEPAAVIAEPSTRTTAPAAPKSKTPAAPKAKDPYTLKVTGCERSENSFLDQVEIEIRITNNSDSKATYFFDISVESADGDVVGSGFGSLDNVRPGKSGKASSYASLTDEDYDGALTCIVEVTDF